MLGPPLKLVLLVLLAPAAALRVSLSRRQLGGLFVSAARSGGLLVSTHTGALKNEPRVVPAKPTKVKMSSAIFCVRVVFNPPPTPSAIAARRGAPLTG